SVLDTSYLLFPDYFKKLDLYQLRNWSAYSIKKAQKIIAISNSTSFDLAKYYHVVESKIKVIYPGFNKNLFQPNISESWSQNIA
ncbi:glycosyltransferase, partial [Bilophila wadsworthia]|uniref:glycosyltransferase n=1 Tax=Bilophila wadsworthia TaxID=35833 RepID=UPI001EDABE43